jgi:signal peptidase II
LQQYYYILNWQYVTIGIKGGIQLRFWLTAGAVLILDRLSKWWIMGNMNIGDSWPLISGFINIRYIHNKGAAFGILQGRGLLFILMAVVVIIATIYFIRKYQLPPMAMYSLGLIVGGALGNLIDRVIYGPVIDFISVGWFPVFNLADSAIVCGGILLVLWMFIDETFKSAA